MYKTIAVSLSVAFVFFCVLSEETQSPRETIRILLAMEKTAFKSELIDRMDSLLTKQGYATTIVRDSRKQITEHKAADYDMVFITNSGVNSKVRPWITKWIANNAANANRILLHTTQTREWEVVTTVDAVTSASARKEAEKFAGDYVARLTEKLPSGDAR